MLLTRFLASSSFSCPFSFVFFALFFLIFLCHWLLAVAISISNVFNVGDLLGGGEDKLTLTVAVVVITEGAFCCCCCCWGCCCCCRFNGTLHLLSTGEIGEQGDAWNCCCWCCSSCNVRCSLSSCCFLWLLLSPFVVLSILECNLWWKNKLQWVRQRDRYK